MSKILITGASGFVGTYLVESLAKKHTIDAISRKSYLLGVNKTYTWENFEDHLCDYDVVIHLAGLAHDTNNKTQREVYYAVNHQLTGDLVNWINQANRSVKLIYMSSIKVYENAVFLKEDTPKKPNTIYGQSKLAAEKEILKHLSDLHYHYILEPTMIYGEGNKGNLPRLYKALLGGTPFFFGNWKNKRSILYIENLMFIISALMDKSIASGCYLVSDDDSISTIDMIEVLFKQNQQSFIRWNLPNFMVPILIKLSTLVGIQTLNKLLGNLEVSNHKIKDALGIDALPISVYEGLKRSAIYFKNHV